MKIEEPYSKRSTTHKPHVHYLMQSIFNRKYQWSIPKYTKQDGDNHENIVSKQSHIHSFLYGPLTKEIKTRCNLDAHCPWIKASEYAMKCNVNFTYHITIWWMYYLVKIIRAHKTFSKWKPLPFFSQNIKNVTSNFSIVVSQYSSTRPCQMSGSKFTSFSCNMF